jgi:hypothetical protein
MHMCSEVGSYAGQEHNWFVSKGVSGAHKRVFVQEHGHGAVDSGWRQESVEVLDDAALLLTET